MFGIFYWGTSTVYEYFPLYMYIVKLIGDRKSNK